MYAHYTAKFGTPKGNMAEMVLREDSNDWNTAAACMSEDEYGLAGLELTGHAIDVGGYLGAVGIALAMDNPGLTVDIIEPVPENAALIRENVALNNVGDRVTVIEKAASAPGVISQKVAYAYQGDENALHHAWVGNSTIVSVTDCTVADITAVALSDLRPADFLKIDCEGGEWEVFKDPAVKDIPRIHGEWHPTNGHTRADLTKVLKGHDVTFADPESGPAGFVAVRRG